MAQEKVSRVAVCPDGHYHAKLGIDFHGVPAGYEIVMLDVESFIHMIAEVARIKKESSHG